MFIRRSKNKFGNKVKERAGRSFASKGEAGLFDYIKLLERAGEVELIQAQARIKLEPFDIYMIPDFKVLDRKTGSIIYYEYKGFETPEYRLKRKIWMVVGPARLRVFKGYGRALKMVEEIVPTHPYVEPPMQMSSIVSIPTLKWTI